MDDFTYHEVLDLWITKRSFLDREIEVRLYCGDNDNFSRLAEKALEDVGANWELLKQAICDELLPQNLDHADADVDPNAFFSRLTLQTIDLDAIDIMYTLFFSDGGLFGGHGIQVLWDPEEDFAADVSLVG